MSLCQGPEIFFYGGFKNLGGSNAFFLKKPSKMKKFFLEVGVEPSCNPHTPLLYAQYKIPIKLWSYFQ